MDASQGTCLGWRTLEVDGHDTVALAAAMRSTAAAGTQPTAIVAHTVKGKGISFAEHNMKWHHKSSIKSNEVEELMRAIEASE